MKMIQITSQAFDSSHLVFAIGKFDLFDLMSMVRNAEVSAQTKMPEQGSQSANDHQIDDHGRSWIEEMESFDRF
jgi:hypothetical protein